MAGNLGASLASIIVGNAFPPTETAILRSRVATLTAGGLGTEEWSYCDDEDEAACLQTLSVILLGVLAFQAGYTFWGQRALSILFAFLGLSIGSYESLLWHLLGFSLGGIALGLVGMFVASRLPVLGFLTTSCLFIATMTFLGCILSRMFTPGLCLTLAFCGGVLRWSFLVQRPFLAGAMRLLSLVICLLSVVAMMAFLDGSTSPSSGHLTLAGKLAIGLLPVLVVVGGSFFLGHLFQAITSASSPNVSPFTTSAYALGIVSIGLWVLFLQFVLRALIRRRKALA